MFLLRLGGTLCPSPISPPLEFMPSLLLLVRFVPIVAMRYNGSTCVGKETRIIVIVIVIIVIIITIIVIRTHFGSSSCAGAA